MQQTTNGGGAELAGHKVYEMELAGRPLTLEFGKYAKQANGSVLVRYGDTAVLVTATASDQPREGIDFFPLTVDVEERQYAAGRIPGNFFRREGRPTERAILAARLTDRPIRPLFDEGFRNDVQVIATIFSVDLDNSPEICSMIGASAALTMSDIPFQGPIGAVEVGLSAEGELILNPTREQIEQGHLKLTVAGTRDAVLMVEAGAGEVPEETMLEAILFGHRAIVELVHFQDRIRAEIGKAKREIPLYTIDEVLEQEVRALATEPLRRAVMNPDKQAREAATQAVQDDVRTRLQETYPEQGKDIDHILRKILKEEVRRGILDHGIRPDGRAVDEIRPISCEVGLLPRVHGSGLFTRGQTQVLTAATLGAVGDEQMLDSLGVEEYKRYMHHYNFPPYSVGETRPLRGPGRREIGHGALAERALEPVIPAEEQFPYTIRLVSEVLESNGSTSMASVCGSTLALMDAGVPIKAPVAGVAMGLVGDGQRFAVLTDIQGIEDALGDMDFKVAGTASGVTALQMDIKISGVNREILQRALEQARKGRLFILDKMLATLPEPRRELSPYAPRIFIMEIDPDKIRYVIGPGGKTINKIIEETKIGDRKVDINIENDGKVYIAAVNLEAAQKTIKMIEDLTRDVEVGGVYTGKVVRIMKFGAFVEILPGQEGMVHISELALERVNRVEDAVKIGDLIKVKVTEIDELGRINLSRKAVLREELGDAYQPANEDEGPDRRNGPRPDRRRDDRRHGDRRPDDRRGGNDRPRGGDRR